MGVLNFHETLEVISSDLTAPSNEDVLKNITTI